MERKPVVRARSCEAAAPPSWSTHDKRIVALHGCGEHGAQFESLWVAAMAGPLLVPAPTKCMPRLLAQLPAGAGGLPAEAFFAC
mmetsp:Transcript_31543/g.85579  ORF Transcript_31543/g.85579 Transcript_31543/m.85579 type:complete len:84 (-) Transcript_31543:174-425(-)